MDEEKLMNKKRCWRAPRLELIPMKPITRGTASNVVGGAATEINPTQGCGGDTNGCNAAGSKRGFATEGVMADPGVSYGGIAGAS